MKALPATVVASFLLCLGAPVAAKENKPAEPDPKSLGVLKKGLDAMAAAAVPPGQSNRPDDPDRGDDNASDRAIQMVCTKDTPAAQRSAICPKPVSP